MPLNVFSCCRVDPAIDAPPAPLPLVQRVPSPPARPRSSLMRAATRRFSATPTLPWAPALRRFDAQDAAEIGAQWRRAMANTGPMPAGIELRCQLQFRARQAGTALPRSDIERSFRQGLDEIAWQGHRTPDVVAQSPAAVLRRPGTAQDVERKCAAMLSVFESPSWRQRIVGISLRELLRLRDENMQLGSAVRGIHLHIHRLVDAQRPLAAALAIEVDVLARQDAGGSFDTQLASWDPQARSTQADLRARAKEKAFIAQLLPTDPHATLLDVMLVGRLRLIEESQSLSLAAQMPLQAYFSPQLCALCLHDLESVVRCAPGFFRRPMPRQRLTVATLLGRFGARLKALFPEQRASIDHIVARARAALLPGSPAATHNVTVASDQTFTAVSSMSMNP